MFLGTNGNKISRTLKLHLSLIIKHGSSQGGEKQVTESLKQKEIVLLSLLFPLYDFLFDFI